MCGAKIEDMKGTGSITKCTDMEKYNGLMEGGMKENIKMIKKKGKALFIGQMGGSMSEDGKMGSSMERDTFICRMDQLRWENGRKARK